MDRERKIIKFLWIPISKKKKKKKRLLLSLLLGNFLCDSFLFVQVSIETLQKVFAIVR